MEKSKIKVIVILILLITNLFLLFIVISNALDSARSLSARNEAIFEILASRSIALSDEVSLSDQAPAELTLARNLEGERKMVASLIGGVTVTDRGGSIYFYEGAYGSATFRGTGDFQVDFSSGSITEGGDPVKTSVSTLGRMGISCVEEGAVVTVEGGETSVVLNCTYKKDPVFNMSVVCRYVDGSLSVIEGRRPLDDVSGKSSPDDYPNVATIIMSFLNYLDASGEVCTRITALDLGFFAMSKDVSSYSLLPVWRVSTDIGTYYFDALSGDPVWLDS